MEELNRGDRIDKTISLIVSLQVFLLGAKNSLIQGVPFLYTINDRLNSIIMAFVGVLYLYAIFVSLGRRLSTHCLLFWGFIAISFVFTYLVFPQNVPSIKETFLRMVTILFLTSFLLSKLKVFYWLKKYMTLFAYPTVIAGVIGGVFISMTGHITTSEYEGNNYAMSLSYASLVAVMWLLHSFFKEKNKVALLFALTGIVVILLYGSRNPLLAIISYVLIELLDSAENGKNGAKRSFYRVLLFFSAIAMLFYKEILIALSGMAESFGFNSRTLTMLSSDGIDMSNRDTIHDQLWNLINENPLTGIGIQGDVARMDEMAHGLYLNMLSTYGYIIGIAFIIYFFAICLSALKRAKGLDHQILVIYMCLVIPRGFTGGDMWQSDIFWWLMAIIFVIQSKRYNYVRKNIVVQNQSKVVSFS